MLRLAFRTFRPIVDAVCAFTGFVLVAVILFIEYACLVQWTR